MRCIPAINLAIYQLTPTPMYKVAVLGFKGVSIHPSHTQSSGEKLPSFVERNCTGYGKAKERVEIFFKIKLRAFLNLNTHKPSYGLVMCN